MFIVIIEQELHYSQVHAAATTNTEKKKTNQKETRQEQLAHIQVHLELPDKGLEIKGFIFLKDW